MTSKVRKKRTINNPIVDIDDVFIGRGDAYVNWMGIAKHKLYKREVALLQQRRDASDTIIGRMIKSFARNQSPLFEKHNLNVKEMEATVTRIYQQQLQSQIMDPKSPLVVRYMESIQKLLTPWNGYHPKKTIDSFREYFQESRGWLDRNKMTTMAHNLWIPMMHSIEEVSRKAASQTFHRQSSRLQKAYADYMKTWLFLGLGEHQIKPNNCAHKWLIPATVYGTLRTAYHPTLAIQLIDGSKKAHFRVCYLRAIEGQIESLKQSFEAELAMIYTQRARGLQAQQSDDVIMARTDHQDTYLNGSKSLLSETYSAFQSNGRCHPSYPMVRNNKTHAQPLPFFPLRQSPTLPIFHTQTATCSQAQIPQQSEPYSAFQSNGRYYPSFPMVHNNKTPAQPPSFIPCVNHRRTSPTFYTRNATCSQAQLAQQSDDRQDTHFNTSVASDVCDTYSAFQPNGRYSYPGMRNSETRPLAQPSRIRSDALFVPSDAYTQDTYSNTCGASEMLCDTYSEFELNDPYPNPYPVMRNIETTPSPPSATAFTSANMSSEWDRSAFPNC
eukprot:368297_1